MHPKPWFAVGSAAILLAMDSGLSIEVEALERLRALDSCVVSDALDALGLAGATSHLRAAWGRPRVVGRAITSASEKIRIGSEGRE